LTAPVLECWFEECGLAALIALAVPLRAALPAWALVVLMAPLLADVSSPLLAIVFHPMTLEFVAGAAVGLSVLSGAARGGRLSVLAGLVLLAVHPDRVRRGGDGAAGPLGKLQVMSIARGSFAD
jgi:hypothetical protein